MADAPTTEENKTATPSASSAPAASPATGGAPSRGPSRGPSRSGGGRPGGAPRGGGGGHRGGGQGGGGDRRRNERNPRRSRKPRERVRPEFDQKIISIRRVTRVVAGGRRFSFSVAIVAGNGKGKVGVGLGKASDTALAIEKALRDAKRNMLEVVLTDEMSIPYETGSKFASSDIIMMPAPGAGLRAGSSVRTVLELAGIKNVTGKILSRSKNRYNNAQATIDALKKLKK